MKARGFNTIGAIILSLLCGQPLLAQKNVPYRFSQNVQNIKNPLYKSLQNVKAQKELAGVGISGDVAEWFATMNYSDTTIRNLSEAGIDIVKGLQDFHGRDEKFKAILSDCIVIGHVSRIEYDPGKVPYHTIAHVSVTKYLRNDYKLSKKEILVMIQSGPTGKDSTLTVSHEDHLEAGQDVLLFLSASALLVSTKHNSPQYFEKLLTEEDLRFEIQGGSGGTYPIEGNSILSKGKKRDLNEVINEIKSATKLLNRTPNN